MRTLIIKLAPASRAPREIRARVFAFVASTRTKDRDGDIIEPTGWQTSEFMENPAVLASHDNRAWPVASVIKLGVENGALRGELEFPPEGTSAASTEAYRLTKAGTLRALSVGFRGDAWEPLPDGGRRYTKATLYEISLVAVASNPDAMVKAATLGRVTVTPRSFSWPPAAKRLTNAQVKALVPRLVRAAVAQAVREKVQFMSGRLPD